MTTVAWMAVSFFVLFMCQKNEENRSLCAGLAGLCLVIAALGG